MSTDDEARRLCIRDLASRAYDLMGDFESIIPGGDVVIPRDLAPIEGVLRALGQQNANLHNRLTLVELALRLLVDPDFDPATPRLRVLEGGRSD